MANVVLEDVWKKYGKVEAVKGIDLEIKDKSFYSILGPSGCGKTSTLRMIAGLEEITSGRIYIGDRIVNNLSPKDRNIAMVFETYSLYPHMSVYDNIAFPLKISGLSNEAINKKVMHMVEILDLQNMVKKIPAELAGGQQQRVSIGRALVRNPEIYILDEPISHLDAKLREHMRVELKRMQKDMQTTSLYVTHDQVEAMAMADTIAIMNFGEIQQIGSPFDVYDNPANVFVARFIGSPAMNIIDVEIGSQDGEPVLIGSNYSVPVPDRFISSIRRISSGTKLMLGIRPEHILASSENSQNKYKIPTKVLITEPTGEETIVATMIAKDLIKVMVPRSIKLESDENFWIEFEPDAIRLFDKETTKKLV
jgi:multiple sugar transport system ATP-binding protein